MCRLGTARVEDADKNRSMSGQAAAELDLLRIARSAESIL
jgi:hypothetical protein